MGCLSEFLSSLPSAWRLRWRLLSSWLLPYWAIWFGHRPHQPALWPQLTFAASCVFPAWVGQRGANISLMLPAQGFFNLPQPCPHLHLCPMTH